MPAELALAGLKTTPDRDVYHKLKSQEMQHHLLVLGWVTRNVYALPNTATAGVAVNLIMLLARAIRLLAMMVRLFSTPLLTLVWQTASFACS